MQSIAALAFVIVLPIPTLPPVTDAERFPDAETATRGALLARAYRDYLDMQRVLRPHRTAELFGALGDAERRLELWEQVAAMQAMRGGADGWDEAGGGGWLEGNVCLTLAWLREALGDADYFAGRMPGPVP